MSKITQVWDTPVPKDPTVAAELAEQQLHGVVSSSGGRSHRAGRDDQWDPKELSPKMDHMVYLQLLSPSITRAELAELVGLSVSRVSHIINSGMYKTKYNMRRIKIERLQNSRVAAERQRFEKLRDEMIEAHRTVMKIDKTAHVGKELEPEKLKQRSVSDLLRMSTEQIKEIDRKLDGPNGGDATVGAEVELDTSDPGKAYIRLLGTFRKGTK